MLVTQSKWKTTWNMATITSGNNKQLRIFTGDETGKKTRRKLKCEVCEWISYPENCCRLANFLLICGTHLSAYAHSLRVELKKIRPRSKHQKTRIQGEVFLAA